MLKSLLNILLFFGILIICSKVRAQAPVINYVTPQEFTVGIPVNLTAANTGGSVQPNGYTIDAPLPPGLTLNANTGTIIGTPTAPYPATIYTVTATNAAGLSHATINIKVYATLPPVIPAPAISYQSPQTYLPNVAITPLTPANTGGEVKKYSPGLLINYAGTGLAGRADGPKNTAEFNAPFQLASEAGGNFYLADLNNFAIRKITGAGIVSTYAGFGGSGSANGPLSVAQFKAPRGIAIDSHGNILVADFYAIRKITPAGIVSNLAGGNSSGFADGTGSQAGFDGAINLTIDQADNLYVADLNNLLIRKVTPSGVVTTLAGNRAYGHTDGQGTAATFDGPNGIAIDAAGNVYVADYLTLRKITPTGLVTTIAGNGARAVVNGAALSASFGDAAGVAITPAGDIYILDTGNNVINEGSDVLRLLTATGTLSTVDLRKPDGTRASLSQPLGLILDKSGTLYISGNNNYIQTVSFDKYTIDKPLPAGLILDEFTGVISGTPTTLTPAANYTITAKNTGGSSSTVVNIQVVNTPELVFNAIPDKITCDADFDPGATSIYPITYTSSNTVVADIIASKIHIVAKGTATITATSNGKTLSQTLVVNTIPLPVITIGSGMPIPDCAGISVINFDIVTIENAGANPVYQWRINGINAGTNSPEFMTTAIAMGDVVTCTLTNTDACPYPLSATSNSLTITGIISPLNPLPSALITSSSDNINLGTPVTFTVMPINAGTVVSYQWQVNGVNAGENSVTFTSSSLQNGDRVNCIITSNNPCTAPVSSNTIIINFATAAIIIPPNTFTPNADGINDTWSIPSLSAYPKAMISVFNRNGTAVLQSTGYNKPWDGTYNGKALPAGTYYYFINTKSVNGKFSGSVTIIR